MDQYTGYTTSDTLATNYTAGSVTATVKDAAGREGSLVDFNVGRKLLKFR